MSAPRLFLPLLAAVAALVAGGCAVPGAQRLQGAPDGMPPSLRYVTADVLGFTLYATDAEAWSGATQVAAEPALEQLHGSIGLTADEAQPWVGDHAGIAVRQLDVPGADDDTTAYVADVRSRAKLEEALESAGWTFEDEGPEDLPSVNGDTAELLTRGDGTFRAAAVFDDGLLVARTTDALRDFLEAADEYAVPERRAMSQYAADVADKVPAGAVFRFDFLRTQLRRPFQEDPALLEFARWATESRVLLATRDGWVGLTKGATDDEARLIGAVEWVPDLAEDIEWGPADRAMLDTSADVSIAFDDVGQHLAELLRGITFNNGQYATEQDVPEGEERVELEALFEELDGNASVSVRGRRGIVAVEGAQDQADKIDALLCEAGAPGSAFGDGDELRLLVDLDEGSCGKPTLRWSWANVPTVRAPKPPSPPIVWMSARSLAGCTGPAAGWVTFDGEGEMTFAVDIDRRPSASPVVVGAEGRSSRTVTACDTRALVPFT